MIHRPLAAACAGLVTCASFYPLETAKTLRQAGCEHAPGRPYAALRLEALGAFTGTWTYFETYEALLHDHGTMVAPAMAVVTSSFIRAPCSLAVRRRQLMLNGVVVGTNTSSDGWVRMYCVTVARSIPRAILKYTIYEVLLRVIGAPGIVGGFLCGAAASAICSICFAPLDYVKTCLAAKRSIVWRECYRGSRHAIALSVLSNAFGHAILEGLAGR